MLLKAHPLADIFPMMSDAEIAEIAADIAQHGQREAIVLTPDGRVLDGRNRLRACAMAGVEPKTHITNIPEDEWPSFVVSLNLKRRHLSESQRAMVAAKLANLGRGRPEENPPIGGISAADASSLLNVGERSIERARTVQREGSPELVSAVESGAVSVSAAADLATLPKFEQVVIVAKGEKEILEAAKKIRAERADVRRYENEELKRNLPPAPDGKFDCIVIDPPWQMEKIERDVRPNQVAFDYPTMTETEIANFGVADMAGDNCHLFCWTTHKHLPAALRILEAWGFRYVMTMVWHKPGGFQPIGLPQYNCEFVLYARKGSPSFIDTKQFFACFDAPRREHSRKPDEFYDVVRRVTGGKRIDVFSREPREGFEQFGNEADKFAVAV